MGSVGIKLRTKEISPSNTGSRLHRSMYTLKSGRLPTLTMGEACSKSYTQVDNETEYENMVGKILEKNPTKVIVCIDMTDFENGCRNDMVRTK